MIKGHETLVAQTSRHSLPSFFLYFPLAPPVSSCATTSNWPACCTAPQQHWFLFPPPRQQPAATTARHPLPPPRTITSSIGLRGLFLAASRAARYSHSSRLPPSATNSPPWSFTTTTTTYNLTLY